MGHSTTGLASLSKSSLQPEFWVNLSQMNFTSLVCSIVPHTLCYIIHKRSPTKNVFVVKLMSNLLKSSKIKPT